MKNGSAIIFVRLLFVYIAGILLAYQFSSLILQKSLAVAAILIFSYLLLLNIDYLNFKAYLFKGYTTIALYLLLFCLGAWSCLFNIQNIQTDYFDWHKPDQIKIVVEEEPQLKGKLLRFKAKVIYGYQKSNGFSCQGRMFVTLITDSVNPMRVTYGDELMIPATYQPVALPQNPAVFDFKGWLAIQNIYHQVYLKEPQLLLLHHDRGHPLIAFALTLRKQQIDILKKLIDNPEAFSVASTLLLGYRMDLDKATLDAYAKTGTIHALSVSGMHVGIIYIVLNWLLRFLNRKRTLKIVKALLIIGLIWFYSLLTGFSPAVLRSAIMLTAFILAKTLNRRSNSYNILAFSAFILLVYNPLLIFDVGFQLTFLSVVGLIYLQPVIYHFFYFKYKWADQFWNITAMSLAAQFVTFPLSIYYFHQFPVYFLFSNFFILLPAALMMYIGLGMLLCRIYFLAPALEWIINFTNNGLKWISNLPYATISSIWLNKLELILLCMAMVLILVALTKPHKKLMFSALLIVLLLQCALGFDKLKVHQQQKVIVFRLQKNYAAAYLQSNKAVLFTDLSPASNAYLYSIKPCLDQHHITEIQFKIGYPDLKKIKHL